MIEMKESDITILKRAIEAYGVNSQLNIAIEEFSELTKEICKYKRYKGNIENIIEEMADCYIMLEQMKTIFNLGSTVIYDVADKKIKRLKNRLDKHQDEKGCVDDG